MKYKSTRGKVNNLSFVEAVMMGLADDGGLIVPNTIPQVTPDMIEKMRKMSFKELAMEVTSMYIDKDEMTTAELQSIVESSYGRFRHPEICPLTHVPEENMAILELFHGPTFSFKDVALQFLGSLFEWILTKKRDTLNHHYKTHGKMNVLVATSGDTGSAAIHGLRNRNGINVFVLYPDGKISPVQELQMVSVLDDNIHALAVTGSTFDDTQAIVKEIFSDLPFKNKFGLTAVNSINWARILVQTVYYFYSYFRASDDNNRKLNISYSVPTGNFGDILAGYYARRMGLPINKLIVSTNENDILDRFFKTGCYEKTGHVIPTCAPSMDIKIASNFERYLYYLYDENAEELVKLMNSFHKDNHLMVSKEKLDLVSANDGFLSSSANHDQIISIIKYYHTKHNIIVDPHTAIGISGAINNNLIPQIKTNSNNINNEVTTQPIPNNNLTICLSTAHPAKFSETVQIATNVNVEACFEGTKSLLGLPQTQLHKHKIVPCIDTIEQYITQNQ